MSTSYGTSALKVHKKLFARLREDERQLVVFVDFMEREALVQASPVAAYEASHPGST